ncbi:DNA polymerase III subunit chi [Eikenella sp. S3360]|uniref:DNA polymerase III subunit chi n=1 Tax=Eikenella glucosivorans TaxID=2766967 RepID=A0ABS0N8J2_9NEIS|nr:DNA polymerase III subunit chi [Eikenella glucosivorans]MBH5328600.1 DNA polymerase III subunit chi [Eikenella glucosivorans]
MPTVTFYTHVADLEQFACRLSKRAVEAGCRVLVWSDSAEQTEALDKLLWSFEPESFLPHEIWLPDMPMPPEPAVLLADGSELPAIAADWVVLNLSAAVWSRAPQVPARILEIVGSSEPQLAAARLRFSAYRQSGGRLEYHKMQGKA